MFTPWQNTSSTLVECRAYDVVNQSYMFITFEEEFQLQDEPNATLWLATGVSKPVWANQDCPLHPFINFTHLMLLGVPLFSIAAIHELTKTGTEVFCLSHRCPMWQPNTLSENWKRDVTTYTGILMWSQHHFQFCCKFNPMTLGAFSKKRVFGHFGGFQAEFRQN